MNSWLSGLLRPAVASAERGRLPDAWIRWGIRRLCRSMLGESVAPDHVDALVRAMRASPVALVPELANEQHYEVPPEFFRAVLGPHLKYSCCHWAEETRDLAQAEAEALAITVQRAEIEDGMSVLELGCGWGSLTLWTAEHFPRTRITAVTNSRLQAHHLESQANRQRLTNVRVVRADMNELDLSERFDRVVSVEMFEHMRNWEVLLSRIARWLRPDGKAFVHIFCHRSRPYLYRSDREDWMGHHFFSGGIMPSRDLLCRFDRDLVVSQRWDWSGEHYRKTAEAWLARLDLARDRVLPVLARPDGPGGAILAWNRWRIFFLACAELFGYRAGEEWGVSHYRLEPRRPAP